MKLSGQTFLDALPSHPIFHLGVSENNAWQHDHARRLKRTPPSPLISASSSSSSRNPATQPPQPTHRNRTLFDLDVSAIKPAPDVSLDEDAQFDDFSSSLRHSVSLDVNDPARPGDFWPDPASRARDCIPKTCLATAGTGDELYVAVGRHVRSLNLRETKAAWTECWKKGVREKRLDELARVDEEEAKEWISNVEYKTLVAECVTFPIRQMSANPSGRILAVAGDQDVAVILLPRSGSSFSSGTGRRRIGCKSYIVGAFNHSTGVNNYVVQIGWHPLGDGGQHLMVLTVDGILRIYDIANSYDEAEQAIPLTPAAAANNGLSRGFNAADEEEVSAFVFGSAPTSAEKQISLGWLALTVYSLTRGGDIYAVCPVLPKRCILHSDYLDSLLDTTEAKIQDAELDASARLQRHSQLNFHRQWLKKLKQRSSPCDGYFSSSSSNGVNEPSSLLRSIIDHAMSPPALQGPFLLQPRPADFIRTESEADLPVDATGFAILETDTCRTLVVGFEDGKVDVYLEVETLEALWPKPVKTAQQRQVSELPVLAVYESIDLGVPCRGPLTLTTDPIYSDTFYVHHSAGLQAVVVKGLADLLKKMYTSNDEGDDWSEIAKRSEPSQARWIVSTMPLESSESTPVIGLVVLDDPLLGYNLLLLTSAFQAVNIELAMRRLTDVQSSTNVTETEAEASHDTLNNKLRLPPPIFQPSEALASSFPKQPKIAAGTRGKEISMDEEGLRYLGNIVEKCRQEVREVGRASEQTAKRLQLQCEMLSLHVEQLADAQADAEERERIFEEQQEKLLARARRQRMLTARADTVLQKLMDRHQPTLSVYEEKWFSELRKTEIKVRGTGASSRQEEFGVDDFIEYRREAGIGRRPPSATSYVAKMEEIQMQIQRLKDELDHQAARRPSSVHQTSSALKRLSNRQLEMILSGISLETAMLDRAKNQVDMLHKRMQSMGFDDV